MLRPFYLFVLLCCCLRFYNECKGAFIRADLDKDGFIVPPVTIPPPNDSEYDQHYWNPVCAIPPKHKLARPKLECNPLLMYMDTLRTTFDLISKEILMPESVLAFNAKALGPYSCPIHNTALSCGGQCGVGGEELPTDVKEQKQFLVFGGQGIQEISDHTRLSEECNTIGTGSGTQTYSAALKYWKHWLILDSGRLGKYLNKRSSKDLKSYMNLGAVCISTDICYLEDLDNQIYSSAEWLYMDEMFYVSRFGSNSSSCLASIEHNVLLTECNATLAIQKWEIIEMKTIE